MKLKSLIHSFVLSILVSCLWIMSSCDVFNEDLPECRFYVKFKYDYNMLSADAFHTQVDKVELYVFDKEGVFLFKQSEEGSVLSTGSYRMEVKIPMGQYKMMAWAGVHDSYDVPSLVAGTSTITDLKLKLKRESSLIIDKELEPLWYGEILNVNFTGDTQQTETINLIKDTNKIRFAFQANNSDEWTVDVNAYEYEIIESNGFLDYDNSLLEDDVLSYRPYYKEQRNPSMAVVEMNTMRLMANREARLVVTEKATGKKVFNINMTDFLLITEMQGYKWGAQEYLDRQSEYVIIFFFSGPISEAWTAIKINVNGWTHYIQME